MILYWQQSSPLAVNGPVIVWNQSQTAAASGGGAAPAAAPNKIARIVSPGRLMGR